MSDIKFEYNEDGILVAYKNGVAISEVITMGDEITEE